jgi:hypothetical protein
VPLDDGAGDRQAEAAALRRLLARHRTSIEAIERAHPVHRIKTGPGVDHIDGHGRSGGRFLRCSGQAHRHLTIARRVLDCVVQQNHEQAPK